MTAEHAPSHPDVEGTLLPLILRHDRERPDADALRCGEAVLSWAQLRERVLSLAGAIAARKGERVALVGAVSAELVVAYLATVAAGKCAVPLQTSVHPDALAGMIADCDPGLVFADSAHHDLVAPALPAGTETVRLDEASALAGFTAGGTPLDEARTVAPDMPFNIIYSSGTTGRPKGIVHPHAMRYRQAERGLFGLGPHSTMLLATPLYSNTTLMPMLSALYHGARVVMMPKFEAEAYLDLAETFGATHTMLVPVQYQRILASPSFSSRGLSRFEIKQCTGAPMPVADKMRAAEAWPGRFLEVYGLTEGGCTCILDVAAHPDKAHTVGRPAEDNTVRVVDEAGRDVPPGERGEIIGRSPMMMTGYFRNEAATREFHWRDGDGTTYHRTGDIGAFDEDGFLALMDRKKDVIISGGFNIYASDLEEVLLGHPDVAEAAVIGVPSEKWGEAPLGIVVAKSHHIPAASDVCAWANARVGKMQRLSAVEIRPELPRNAVGKVLKQDLKQHYQESGP